MRKISASFVAAGVGLVVGVGAGYLGGRLTCADRVGDPGDMLLDRHFWELPLDQQRVRLRQVTDACDALAIMGACLASPEGGSLYPNNLSRESKLLILERLVNGDGHASAAFAVACRASDDDDPIVRGAAADGLLWLLAKTVDPALSALASQVKPDDPLSTIETKAEILARYIPGVDLRDLVAAHLQSPESGFSNHATAAIGSRPKVRVTTLGDGTRLVRDDWVPPQSSP
jgi:hypothetical protein